LLLAADCFRISAHPTKASSIKDQPIQVQLAALDQHSLALVATWTLRLAYRRPLVLDESPKIGFPNNVVSPVLQMSGPIEQ